MHQHFICQGVKCNLPILPNEMMVYSDLINSHANNATVMPLGWLGPHCLHYFTKLELIREPIPTYDKKQDTFYGYVSGSLPMTEYKPPIFQIDLLQAYKNTKEIQSYFMFLLLNGEISEPFACLKKYLITKPNVFINNTAYVSKAVNIMHLIKKNEITNVSKLCLKWEKDAMFLLTEVLLFYKEASHQYVRALWPPFAYKDGKIQITQHHRDLLKKINGSK